jgi:hypothetical protein
MKRIVAVLAAVAAVAAITATVAFAQTPAPPANQWGSGATCPGWGAAGGDYTYSASPMVQTLADTIGISADELVAELQAGKSVLDVAAGRASEEALVDALLAYHSEVMDARVASGYLTQAQADQMLEFMAERMRLHLETPGFAAGAGRGGMMGPGAGMMGSGGPGAGGCGAGVGGPGMMQGGSGGMMGGSFGPQRGGMMGGGFGGMMGGGSGPRFQSQSN